ncbi:hypothetical protein [Amycolatopsis suaedae]|uniref:hypothetical protein n=1 Tax=Amycolatopsis suaedae TaxID=2510978 RepID=UPI00196A3A3E|nr:hypothetical protein [Amycolatopsis suaedae]
MRSAGDRGFDQVDGGPCPQPGAERHSGTFGQERSFRDELAEAAALLCGSLPAIAVTKRAARKLPDRVHAVAYLVFLGVVLVAMIMTALLG